MLCQASTHSTHTIVQVGDMQPPAFPVCIISWLTALTNRACTHTNGICKQITLIYHVGPTHTDSHRPSAAFFSPRPDTYMHTDLPALTFQCSYSQCCLSLRPEQNVSLQWLNVYMYLLDTHMQNCVMYCNFCSIGSRNRLVVKWIQWNPKLHNLR